MLLFAVPGTPLSTPAPGGSIEGLHYTHKLGLRAMEIEWVQRVPTNVEHMENIRVVAHDLGIALTIHAPYYVNLCTDDRAKLLASKKRILHALTMGELCGAISVCVHPGFYQGLSPNIALDRVRRATEDILRHKKKYFPSVNLAYETMGKPTQFGTLEEVLMLSKEFDLFPCIDPAHLHARSNGAWNTETEWNDMFNLYATALGKKSLGHTHLHFSGIAYGPKGERHHLPLKESDAHWQEFLGVLKKRQIGGVCVCESPLQEEDTLLLQKTYEKAQCQL